MDNNSFDREIRQTHQPFTWLYVGLLLSAAGVLTGAGLLIWQFAKLICR